MVMLNLNLDVSCLWCVAARLKREKLVYETTGQLKSGTIDCLETSLRLPLREQKIFLELKIH